MSAPLPTSSQKAIEPQVAQAAAQWFSRATSGEFGESDRRAWMHWRQSHPAHELAWQQVESVSRSFGMLLPGAGMAALARRSTYGRRQVLRSLAVLCVGGGVGWLAWRQTPWHDADYRTATGERRELNLADGTRLMLNTATAVGVQFSAIERRIELLHGEIQVATAADALQRPFVVATRFGLLRPLGTRFVVRADAGLVRLSVLEGSVQAQAQSKAFATPVQAPTLVHAGESVQLHDGGISAEEPAHASADAWTQGLLMADGWSLAAFTAELSRYRTGLLTCDASVAGLRLSGAFPLDDTDRALVAATRALPVRLQTLTRYWVRIVPS